MALTDPEDEAKLLALYERLRGKVSDRKGWLILAATVGHWVGPVEPWWPGVAGLPERQWRALLVAQAEGRAGPAERQRLLDLLVELKTASVRVQDFEAAACWRDVEGHLRYRRGPAGRDFPRAAIAFPLLFMSAAELAGLFDELFGDLLNRPRLDPGWLRWQGGAAVHIARRIDQEQDFADLGVLADALQDAGCDEPGVLAHCHAGRRHERGCWLIDWCLRRV